MLEMESLGLAVVLGWWQLCLPGGHLTMSGDIIVSHLVGRVLWHLVGGGAQVQDAAPTTEFIPPQMSTGLRSRNPTSLKTVSGMDDGGHGHR